MKRIYIKWVDSKIVAHSWIYVSDINEEAPIVETLGFLVKETKSSVFIASSKSKKKGCEEQLAQVAVIPKKSILKRKDI